MVIAVLISVFASLQAWSIALLGILGVIVGLLNIGDEEVQMFLVASIAFVVAASQMGQVFNAMTFLGKDALVELTRSVVIFTAPGALVVAFKALYAVAKDN